MDLIKEIEERIGEEFKNSKRFKFLLKQKINRIAEEKEAIEALHNAISNLKNPVSCCLYNSRTHYLVKRYKD